MFLFVAGLPVLVGFSGNEIPLGMVVRVVRSHYPLLWYYFLSGKNLNILGKTLGESILFELNEDPNPLGVDMPEVLEVVLEQYEDLKVIFESLTLGKKRNVIHSINRIKDIDKQIQKTISIINENTKPRTKKSL